MAKKSQNINLLMECERRFSQKPWYSVEWLNALMGRLAYLDNDEVAQILSGDISASQLEQYIRIKV